MANSNANLQIIEETVERVYNYLMALNSQGKGLQGLYISVTNGPVSFQPVSDANVQFETELQRTSAPIEGSANWLSLTRRTTAVEQLMNVYNVNKSVFYDNPNLAEWPKTMHSTSNKRNLLISIVHKHYFVQPHLVLQVLMQFLYVCY